MRIICSVCASSAPASGGSTAGYLGEKCSRCGSALVSAIYRGRQIRDGISVPIRRFACRACRFLFEEGQGGDSHGYCPQHLAAALPAAIKENENGK